MKHDWPSRVDHNPAGDPCFTCGVPAIRHRVKHIPRGNPCDCGVPLENHRVRTRSAHEKKEANKYNPEREKTRVRHFHYLGIDGEGQGRHDHKYIFLGVADSTGKRQWQVEDREGLSTVACLDFFLSLPTKRAQAFSFAFNYDITKILTDVGDKHLYYLMRPDRRRRVGKETRKGPKPVLWNGYRLNLQGSKFWVMKGKKKFVIWDIFRFYGVKFTKALADWKVGADDKIVLSTLDPTVAEALRSLTDDPGATAMGVIDFMQFMKDQRAMFDRIPWSDVRTYCLRECRYIAQLAQKLDDAHEAVDLTLTSYYGAGSSATAMLKKMGMQKKIMPAPEAMKGAIGMGFFGGRFENSVIGSIGGRVYNYDISSAYPYQLCLLPCLQHGHWELTTKRGKLETSHNALVKYRLPFLTGISPRTNRNSSVSSWGPYPFRTKDGAISFPIESGGGWVYKEEFLAGERVFPNHVKYHSAWVYETDCDCKPFADIPQYYLERLRIGKEGPGIVLKLGMNSCYGKLAQSIGSAPFNSWLWAGLITSGTRAQLLDMLALHQNPANLLMVATDGIYTRERLDPPRPLDTGTFILADGTANPKPLGGWEEKAIDKGVFVARPGIYFPLSPTKKEVENVRGRGVGKKVIYDNWQKIVDAWQATPSQDTVVSVTNVSRFCGAKSSISFSEKTGFHRADGGRADGTINLNAPRYGQWITRPVDMSFHPHPKRECVNPDGLTLQVRRFPEDLVSCAYSRAVLSRDALILKMALEEALEQPDGDLVSDYETEY